MVRYLDPHLGKAPGVVQSQLAAAHVGGIVHLQHHVRQLVHAHLECIAPRPRRAQKQDLVGLHDALPLAAGIAQQQVGAPRRLNRRAPSRGDLRGQRGEAMDGVLVVVAVRFAHHRDLGGGIPVLQADLAVGDLLASYTHRTAAGKLGLGRRRRGNSRFSHPVPDPPTLRAGDAGNREV